MGLPLENVMVASLKLFDYNNQNLWDSSCYFIDYLKKKLCEFCKKVFFSFVQYFVF